MPWQAALLRFTIFPVPGITINLDEFWKAALAAEPNQVILDRKENRARAQGEFGTGQLSLVAEASPLPRIDWLWTPDEAAAPAEFVSLGAYEDALALFRTLLDPALASQVAPAAHRIALGLILRQPVDSRSTGYDILQPYLAKSLHLDPLNSTDFLYQINRRRSVDVGSVPLLVNRLSRWSVYYQEARQVEFSLITSQLPLLSPAQLLSEYFAAQVDLDINTVATQPITFGVVSPDNAVPTNPTLPYASVLPALQDFAIEIAKQGDIP